MAGTHASAPSGPAEGNAPPEAWPGTIRTLMTVFGAISGMLGIVMLVPADEQYVGIGNWTWKTSEISSWWGIGFVVVGFLLILGAFVWRQRQR